MFPCDARKYSRELSKFVLLVLLLVREVELFLQKASQPKSVGDMSGGSESSVCF